MTPGDMGQAVAHQIQSRGFRVLTALDGRSERSRRLAQEVGLVDVGSITRLVAECDIVLSIMNPAAALAFGHAAADALKATGRNTLIVDCNAVSPDTIAEMERAISGAGGRFLDGAIIGPPPRGRASTNFYSSGPGAADLDPLGGPQMSMTVVSDRIGDASALKMCYGALNKGTQALWLEVLIAAQRLGVSEMLEQQLKQSRGEFHEWALGQFPILPTKAYRWVPEMLEISRTLGTSGVTPRVFQGAADIFDFVAGTALGQETPEGRDKSRTGRDVVAQLAAEPAKPR